MTAPHSTLLAVRTSGNMAKSTEIAASFRAWWQQTARSECTIYATARMNLDTALFVEVVGAICAILPPPLVSTYLSHFEQHSFWRLSILDAYGLLGPDGCTEAFLHPLQLHMPRLCATAEQDVVLLREARDARLSAALVIPEWTPQDVILAVELQQVRRVRHSLLPPTPRYTSSSQQTFAISQDMSPSSSTRPSTGSSLPLPKRPQGREPARGDRKE